MNNKIIKWESRITDFPNTIHILGVYDDFEGFRIVVRGDNNSLYKFKFENYLAYRNADEGARLKSLQLFPTNSREWCLFKSYQSDFIEWIVTESNGIYTIDQITHYIFMTPNDVIEILSLDEPEIEEL